MSNVTSHKYNLPLSFLHSINRKKLKAAKEYMTDYLPLADVKEYPSAYAFIIDTPGLKSGDIKAHVEDNVLVISGERTAGEEEKEEGVKFVRMERVGKVMRKFLLPEYANADAISAACQDGVLTVTVKKVAPFEAKIPKIIEVIVA